MQSWGSWGEVYLLRKWSPIQKVKVISNCQQCIGLKNCMLKIKGWLFIQLIWILKKSKGIWILKSCYNMCEKEMDRDAKSILARAKDGWPLKKLTWESCWGKDHYWLSHGASKRLMGESHQNTPENEISIPKQRHFSFCSNCLKSLPTKIEMSICL